MKARSFRSPGSIRGNDPRRALGRMQESVFKQSCIVSFPCVHRICVFPGKHHSIRAAPFGAALFCRLSASLRAAGSRPYGATRGRVPVRQRAAGEPVAGPLHPDPGCAPVCGPLILPPFGGSAERSEAIGGGETAALPSSVGRDTPDDTSPAGGGMKQAPPRASPQNATRKPRTTNEAPPRVSPEL